jgi:uncharacterized damage-inducible protein DinB
MDREWPDTDASDELRLLIQFLTFLRITVVNKIAHLDTGRASATPLTTSAVVSLIGVVKHLTAVERHWLCNVGGAAGLPELWEKDPDAEWRLRAADTPAAVVKAYREEWARAERALAGRAPSERAPVADGQHYTVRWLLNHVIQETARHVGHMDILREMADGSRGE